MNASIQTSSEVDCFTITASDGETVDVSVVSQVAASSFQPSWRLLDSSGSSVDGPCGGFGRSAPNFACGPLLASGSPYRLEVEATVPGDTGAYGVRFERLTAARTCEDIPLTCAEPVDETIDGPLDTDLFSFSVGDGEMIEITVVSDTAIGAIIDAAWQLIDGTGNSVAGLCGEFAPSAPNFICGPLAASGNPYRLKVGDLNADDSGRYRARFQRLTAAAACSSTALACGIALTIPIADPLETQLFSFSVNDGERIAVTVENSPPFDPHFNAGWRLLNRNGNRVDGVCGDFSPSRANFKCGPLAAAGSPYQIEVGGVSDPVTGNVRVLLNLVTSACATSCPGDCDGSHDVAVTDLLTLVNIALDAADISTCIAGDANHDGTITVNDILTGVNYALDGCPAVAL